MGSQQSADQGVEYFEDANPAANVHRSLLEERSSLPVTLTFPQKWGQVGLICTKGLTKHVSEEQIHKRLSIATSAKQVCQELLEDALDAGGTENITMIVARTPNPRL